MDITKLNTKSVSSFAIKIFFIWLILILISIFFSRYILIPFLFFFESIIDFVSTGISAYFSTAQIESENILRLIVNNDYKIKSLEGGVILNAEETLYVNVHNLTLLTPLIILFSIILSWPFQYHLEFYIRLLTGIIISSLIMLISVPFQLIGIYEKQLWKIAKKNDETYILSPLYYWQVFCDSGGVWMLAIIGAVVSIAIGKSQCSKMQKN